MVLDSLRYWVSEMHVDGFRFDLAAALSRGRAGRPTQDAPLIRDIETDPLLAGTKLIAEAWDAGGEYQVGTFAGERWCEWNGRFRDDVRSFVRGDPGYAVPSRSASSPAPMSTARGRGRRPEHRVRDLSRRHDAQRPRHLRHKRNEANGEGGRDGTDDDRSWDGGSMARPTTRRSSDCAGARSATSWRSRLRSGSRCCSWATRSGARKAATTTPTATTTSRPGSTGRSSSATRTFSSSRASCSGATSTGDPRERPGRTQPRGRTRRGRHPLERGRGGRAGPRPISLHRPHVPHRPARRSISSATRGGSRSRSRCRRMRATRPGGGCSIRGSMDPTTSATRMRPRSRTARDEAGPRSVVLLAARHTAESTPSARRGSRRMTTNAELRRMETVGHPEEGLSDGGPWYRWGPYLAERAWGSVREDYSADGDAWARSRTTMRARGRTAGTRRGSLAIPTCSAGCAWRSRCGTGGTRSSRSGSSA